MPLDESSIPHCSAGDKEIPSHRSTERSCWIGVAALQGLLQCWSSAEQGECLIISVSKPPLVYSALQSVFFLNLKNLLFGRKKKSLEDKL